jgi:hypothetical protein
MKKDGRFINDSASGSGKKRKGVSSGIAVSMFYDELARRDFLKDCQHDLCFFEYFA